MNDSCCFYHTILMALEGIISLCLPEMYKKLITYFLEIDSTSIKVFMAIITCFALPFFFYANSSTYPYVFIIVGALICFLPLHYLFYKEEGLKRLLKWCSERPDDVIRIYGATLLFIVVVVYKSL